MRPHPDVTTAVGRWRARGGRPKRAGYALARRPAMTSRFAVRLVFVRFGPPIPRVDQAAQQRQGGVSGAAAGFSSAVTSRHSLSNDGADRRAASRSNVFVNAA